MGIAALRHRVVLCRQADVIVSPTEMRLNRTDVAEMWASIEPKRASTFSPNGAAMKEGQDARSHVVMARYRPDMNISAMAWIYEARMQSSPRWFKVLSVKQTEAKGTQWFVFDCRVTERGDDLVAPIDASMGPVMGLPSGVRL